MMTVDEKGEELESYPLTNRRTSVSMQHIPSSSLLKELAEKSTFNEDIEEGGKANDTKSVENLNDSEVKKSQEEKVPNNTESYTEDESQNFSSETTSMLKGNNDATKENVVSPQISIVVQDALSEKEGGKVTQDDVKIEPANKQSGCLKKLKNLSIIKLWR